MSTEKVKCLIIGSGPAGYTAAIYTGTDLYVPQSAPLPGFP